MANVLPADEQIAIISSLCEGSTIRSNERITGVHRDTIMRLGVKAGQGCTALLDGKMRNLDCNRLEMDEIWGYVGKKESTFALVMIRPVETCGPIAQLTPIPNWYLRSRLRVIATERPPPHLSATLPIA